MAGLRVGQAYGVSHRPGFGLLGSVPRSLSTQPPYATQALTSKNHQILSIVSFSRQNLFDVVFLVLQEC